MTKKEQTEPPSCSQPALFVVGRDHSGNWVVQDQNAVCGGLFVNRDAAPRFIRFENDDRPQAVVMVSEILELDMTRKPGVASARTVANESQLQRRVA